MVRSTDPYEVFYRGRNNSQNEAACEKISRIQEDHRCNTVVMSEATGNRFDRSEWFYNHPKVTILRQSGINDQSLIFLAIAVYINLIEVCHWFDVKIHAFPSLQKVLISGSKRKEDPSREFFLPISGSTLFQPGSLSTLWDTEEFCNPTDQKSVNIAIVSGSSKILYYKVSDGLVPCINKSS